MKSGSRKEMADTLKQKLNIFCAYEAVQQIPVVKLTRGQILSDFLSLVRELEETYGQFGAVKLEPPADFRPTAELPADVHINSRIQVLPDLSKGKPCRVNPERSLFSKFKSQALRFEQEYSYRTLKREEFGEWADEQQFWRLVSDEQFEGLQAEVEYASDIPTTRISTFFQSGSDEHYDYGESSFNLNRVSDSPLSLTQRSVGGGLKISGVTVPWVYVGMKFSSFCWHVEDLYMHSVNYHHMGSEKVWYIVPPRSRALFQAFCRDKAVNELKTDRDLLAEINLLVDPIELLAAGVAVLKCRQTAGSYILTFPQSYHCGFSKGFNVCEAVNVLPVWSYGHLQEADGTYRQQKRVSILPIEWLLIRNCHRAELQDRLTEYKCRMKQQAKRRLVKFNGKLVEERMDRYDKYSCGKCRRYCVGVFMGCIHSQWCLGCYPGCCFKPSIKITQCKALAYLSMQLNF